MANSFAPKESTIPLRPRTETEKPEVVEEVRTKKENQFSRRDSILPQPKKKGKAYNLYISVDVMERITAMAEKQGISLSQAVSALLRNALERMEE